MSDAFQKKSAGILASVIIGLIILSFLFTGYYTGMGIPSSDVVAYVNREPIKVTEYQRALQQRLEFFKQLTGGKDLTNQQLEQFGIKESVLKWLVEQKLFAHFANQLDLNNSESEIANEIKNQSYFQTNNQFDVLLYKNLLNRNGLTPADYEKSIAESLSIVQAQNLLNNFPISNAYLKELVQLQENSLKINAVQLHKQSLRDFIEIPEKNILEFANDPKNKQKLEEQFLTRKEELNRPEEIKARHILFRLEENETQKETEEELKAKLEKLRKTLTPKNFAQIADKETQDPSGKGTGGDLGWFSRGRMVPAFEDVVFSLRPGTISETIKTPFGLHIVYVEDKREEKVANFDNLKRMIAKEILQEQSTDQLKAVETKVVEEIKQVLTKNNNEEIKQLQEKYQFVYVRDKIVNQLEGNIGSITLEPKQLEYLFQEKINEAKSFVFNNVTNIIIITGVPQHSSTSEEKDKTLLTKLEEERTKQQTNLGQKLRKDLLDHLQQKNNIKTYAHLL